jgi:hypothetical protein
VINREGGIFDRQQLEVGNGYVKREPKMEDSSRSPVLEERKC